MCEDCNKLKLPCVNCILIPVCKNKCSICNNYIISIFVLYKDCSLLSHYIERKCICDSMAYIKTKRMIFKFFYPELVRSEQIE